MVPQVLNVQVPQIFKQAVDTLNIPAPADVGSIIFTSAGAILIACMYGE